MPRAKSAKDAKGEGGRAECGMRNVECGMWKMDSGKWKAKAETESDEIAPPIFFSMAKFCGARAFSPAVFDALAENLLVGNLASRDSKAARAMTTTAWSVVEGRFFQVAISEMASPDELNAVQQVEARSRG